MAADLAQFIQAVVAFPSAYFGPGMISRARLLRGRDFDLDNLALLTASAQMLKRTRPKRRLRCRRRGQPITLHSRMARVAEAAPIDPVSKK